MKIETGNDQVGITGGIGSGKSVVCTIFKLHEVPVYDADREAKRLNDHSPVIRDKLTALFGNELYAQGSLNRPLLASLIFGHREKVAAVNAITHPVLAEDFNRWCLQHKNHPIVMIEAALLYEAGFNRFLDKIITVFSPTEMRLARVAKRDGTDYKTIEKRMKHQMPEEQKVEQADFVIVNDGTKSLIRQTRSILDNLMRAENG